MKMRSLGRALDRPICRPSSIQRSSQRLGAITLLPLGTFMTQTIPELGEIGFNLPHSGQSYKWGEGRCPQPEELVAEEKEEGALCS